MRFWKRSCGVSDVRPGCRCYVELLFLRPDCCRKEPDWQASPDYAKLVRKGGLEPPRFYPPDPKSGASANSATFAFPWMLLIILLMQVISVAAFAVKTAQLCSNCTQTDFSPVQLTSRPEQDR